MRLGVGVLAAVFLIAHAHEAFEHPRSERLLQDAGPHAESLPPLAACGRALCAGEERFRWNGVTAFGLADHLADGRAQEARAFVAWARETGFNVLRVLAMLPRGGWVDLSPADGRRVLPRVFALAREHGMYVQVVALANTNEASGQYSAEAFLVEQVREVGRLCADAGNCILELANEPYHRSQADLDDPALMRRLQRQVPMQLPVAWGAARDDTSHGMAGGTYVVAHVARSGERWARVARTRRLATLAAATGKFVVDSEPIGAAEAREPSRRDSAPEAFFAQGALSRMGEIGATFHCEDCLTAKVPGPVQQRCAEAFVEGRRIIPDAVSVSFADETPGRAPAAAVAAPRDRVFSAVVGDRAWILLLGDATRAGVRYNAGWRAENLLATRSGVELWTAVRSPAAPQAGSDLGRSHFSRPTPRSMHTPPSRPVTVSRLGRRQPCVDQGFGRLCAREG